MSIPKRQYCEWQITSRKISNFGRFEMTRDCGMPGIEVKLDSGVTVIYCARHRAERLHLRAKGFDVK